MSYRTEIVIPPDRYVCIQLPDYVPEGRAVVVIHVHEPDDTDAGRAGEPELDRQDIEWWDEFDSETTGDHT